MSIGVTFIKKFFVIDKETKNARAVHSQHFNNQQNATQHKN
jgi:hypothetical protein